MTPLKKINSIVDHALFRNIVENSDEVFTLIDKNYNVFYRSQSAQRINGYQPTDRLDVPVLDLLQEQDRQRVKDAFEEISKELGLSKTLTFQVNHFDGHPIWLECKFKNLLQDEEVQAIVCVSKDITAQMVINDKLTQEQKHLRLLDSVISSTKDAIMITSAEPRRNPGPRIMYVNEAFTAMTGYTLEEVRGKSPSFLQGPKTDQNELDRLAKAISTWQPCEITVVNYRKNGAEFWMNLSVSPVVDENGKYTHLIAVQRDITDKKELEDLLHKATNLAGIGGWDYDLSNRKVYWSPLACKICEVEESYQPGLREGIALYRNPTDRHLMQHHIDQAVKAGQSFDVEMEITTPKNNIKWVRTVGEPEMVGNRCVRVRGSVQDIDVRKKAEILAKEILAEKNLILESIGDGFFTVNKDWIVTYWNNMAEEVLECKREKVLNKNLWDVFSDSLHTLSYKKYHEALADRCSVNFEDYYEKLDRWFSVSAYCSEGGLSVFFKDITARKINERRIVESEKRYSQLFQFSPLPKWVYDIETLKFLDVNAAALAHYGYSRKEFLALTIRDIRPSEEVLRLEQTIRNSKKKKEFSFQGIFTHRTKSGKLIQVEIQSSIIDYKGKTAKIIIANDITERLAYINAIEEQNEKLKEVSWIQSHVFRAPLSRIMGLVEVAKLADNLEEKEKILDYILSSATELDLVIKDITEKTRISN